MHQFKMNASIASIVIQEMHLMFNNNIYCCTLASTATSTVNGTSASIGIKTNALLSSMNESTSMCTSTEKKDFENVCYDADDSTVIVDLSNDEDLSASENQNKSVVEDDRKSTEHAHVIDNGSRSGSYSSNKTLTIHYKFISHAS